MNLAKKIVPPYNLNPKAKGFFIFFLFFILLLAHFSSLYAASPTQEKYLSVADFFSFRPYFPVYRRHILGLQKNTLVIIDSKTNKKKIYPFSYGKKSRPLGFLELKEGLYFSLKKDRQHVVLYWFDFYTEEIKEVKKIFIKSGEVLFHDFLTIDEDWIFGLVIQKEGRYKISLYSSDEDFRQNKERIQGNKPLEFYLQSFQDKKQKNHIRIHILEKSFLGNVIHLVIDENKISWNDLGKIKLRSARFFEYKGNVYLVFVNEKNSAYVEINNLKLNILKSYLLNDIKDIRLGLYRKNKKLIFEFYFLKAAGGIVSSGDFPLKNILKGVIKPAKLKYIWTPPVHHFYFGKNVKSSGFYLSLTQNDIYYFPAFETNLLLIKDIKYKIKLSSKGLYVIASWKFNKKISKSLNYSYGFTTGINAQLPPPFYYNKTKKLVHVFAKEGVYYFHLQAKTKKDTSLLAHFPFFVFYRLPQPKVSSAFSINENILYFPNQKVSFRLLDEGYNFTNRYLFSAKKLKAPKLYKLKKRIPHNFPVINIKVKKPGKYYLYLVALNTVSGQHSKIKEYEIWTDGDTLSDKSFKKPDSLLLELEKLHFKLKTSFKKLSVKKRRKMLKQIQLIEKLLK